MKILKIFGASLLITLMTVFYAGCSGGSKVESIDDHQTTLFGKTPVADGNYKIYLITMDLTDDFWNLIDTGCRQAVSGISGIDYKWIVPDKNLDEIQMECIDRAVDDGANALLIVANSPRGIIPSLEKAAAKGVKIIFVDNPAEFDCVAFLATDNEFAGTIAGDTLKKGLEEAGITSGTIGMCSNKETVTSTKLRNKGFRKSFEGTNFVLTDTFYMEDDDQSLRDYAAEHPEYVAFFGPNERTARNLGEQMRESGSNQIVMGFDTSDSVLNLLYEGHLYATLQQNPEIMGHDGIKIAVEALNGNFTETNKRIDTGVKVINKD